MMDVRTQLEELAEAPAPPTRLSADGVYLAAYRGRRRRRAAWAATGVIAGALALGLGLQLLRPAGPAPAPQPAGPPAGGPVLSVAATDAEHLYAGVRVCAGDRCKVQLLGSDDAGNTWTVRQDDLAGRNINITAPAPGALMYVTDTDGDETGQTGPKLIWHFHASIDGGRTWRELRTVGTPVEAAPANGWLQCSVPQRLDDACVLQAADPAAGTLAPLAHQPALDVQSNTGPWAIQGSFDTITPDGGRIRTRGPAVALTPDRGRTWTVHTFTEPGVGTAAVATIDGVTGYAVLTVRPPDDSPTATPGTKSTVRVQRTTDGGKTWQDVDPGHTLPIDYAYYQPGEGYVTPSGAHVVLRRDDDQQRWYVSTDRGATYRLERPSGLGDHLDLTGLREPVQTTVPGVYVASDDRAAYRSTDGLHFVRIPIEPVR